VAIAERRTVDVSSYLDLVVIYHLRRVNRPKCCVLSSPDVRDQEPRWHCRTMR
jgi:hypothetical protein